MLTVKIIAVGQLKESFFREAAAEYQKRMGAYCKCKVVELPEARLPKQAKEAQISAALDREGGDIIKAMAGSFGVALCVDGERLSSHGLAAMIERTALGGVSELSFVIGSSHGLSPSVVAHAKATLSLSDMTLPHQLCRVVLMEQVYRALSINAGAKYHK